jgi:hypothetical protein
MGHGYDCDVQFEGDDQRIQSTFEFMRTIDWSFGRGRSEDYCCFPTQLNNEEKQVSFFVGGYPLKESMDYAFRKISNFVSKNQFNIKITVDYAFCCGCTSNKAIITLDGIVFTIKYHEEEIHEEEFPGKGLSSECIFN